MEAVEAILDSLGFSDSLSGSDMRISLTIFVILISTYIVNASVLDPVIENVVHLKASKPPSGVPGIWKKKTIWKPRWIKEWKSAKIMKPVWRKVWSPIQIREWMPIPKPPPGWDPISTPLSPLHLKPQKAPLRSSLGHNSFAVQSSTKMLLWDPVPYPDSQQPPPPPLPQPFYNSDVSCAKGICDNNYSQSMTHKQILEIIDPRYQMLENYQNPVHSETVNRLSRLFPNGNNWGLPQSHQNFQSDNGFKNYQELSEFLVPPKFQSLLENDFSFQQINKHNPPITNTPINHSPELEIQNNYRQWVPLPSENKIKGHLITKIPKQPHKLNNNRTPNLELHTKNDENNSHKGLFQNSNNNLREKSVNQTQNSSTGQQPQADGDFIQEAQLVGEFHYSEFDLPNLKPEHNEPQLNLRKKELADKPQQSTKIIGQESVQKTTLNPQLVMENKPKQTRKEINNASVQSQIKQLEIYNNQSKWRVQKKNTGNFSSNSNLNFRQQEATIKEIYPIYKTPQNVNLTTIKSQKLTSMPINIQEKSLPLNHSFIKLMTGSVNASEFHVQQQTEVYQFSDIPKRINAMSFQPNHRFFQPPEIKLQEKSFPSNNSIALLPETTKSEKPLFDKNSHVQLVFATTSDDYTHSKEDLQKTTTTEPYEIIFSSSLLSIAEESTQSPLIIVTPTNSNKSQLITSI